MKRLAAIGIALCVFASFGPASADPFSVRFNRASLEDASARERVRDEVLFKVDRICAARADARFLTLSQQRRCRAELAGKAFGAIGDARLSAD